MIPTVQRLRANARRLDRIAAAATALAAMRDQGLTLHLCMSPSGRHWSLSDGHPLDADVALRLINSPQVVGVGDALFAGLSQTWRFCETTEPDGSCMKGKCP
jgi:hypothetical protein